MATVLFTTPENLLKEVRSSSVSVDGARFVVVEAFNALLPPAREALETLFEILPREGQRVILGQPLSPEAEAFGKAHMTRAVHIPPRAVERDDPVSDPSRGQIQYRITGDNRELELLQVVSAALEGGIHHVLVFTRSEDQAADTGDFLGVHGFLAGEPGDKELPVWLGVEELPARKVVEGWGAGAPIMVLSLDVPADADSLDRRHRLGEEGLILVRSREFPHLREIARRGGYRLLPAKEPLPTRVGNELERLTALLERTMEDENLAPHFLALEPIFQDHSPGEVAAALLFLLQRKGVAAGAKEIQPSAMPLDDKGTGPAPKTWVRLFVGVGEKEEIGPGDLLGAIAGEAGVDGSQVGKIEIRETFSLVEVVSTVAERVVKGLNGTTIRGRSVRVDYDRGGPTGRGSAGGRGGRPPGRGGSPGGRPGAREGPRRRLKGDGPKEG
jgi:ATP-dependent RNA helicase DeaD